MLRANLLHTLLGCVLLTSVPFAVGCAAKSNTPIAVDSNTNWLKRCGKDSQCNGTAVCLCGLCTKACDDDAACKALGDGASCESTTKGVAKDRCEAKGHGNAKAVCVVSCDTHDICPDDALQCVDSLCELIGSNPNMSMPDGSMTDASNADATTTDASDDAMIATTLDAGEQDADLLTDASDALVTPECVPGPCANGGHCSTDGATCECPVGISGSTCDVIANVRQLVAGTQFSCALLASNAIKCWGYNESGQLGQGDFLSRGDAANELGTNLPPVDLGTDTVVHSIAAGVAHACALLVTGEIKCWGLNATGELGLGDTTNRGDFANQLGANLQNVPLGTAVATQVSAGANHTCALMTDGRVACWGSNTQGELGIDTNVARGDMPNQLGANLQYVKLGVGVRAKQVIASNGFSCALLEGDTVKCWGSNTFGQLGQGDTTSRGASAGDMAALQPIALGDVSSGIRAIDSHNFHVCMLLGNGAIRCWGYNGAGELGIGGTSNVGDMANQMGANLVDAKIGAAATQLIAGNFHTCAVLTGNSLKCWGQNTSGQLGVGDTLDRSDDATEIDSMLPTVMLPTGTITQAIAGKAHTCALLDGTNVYCFGENGVGELGRGDTNDIGDELTEQVIPPPAVAL